MTKKVSTGADQITELLTRGVDEVIVRKTFEELLRSGKKVKLYLGIDPTGSQLHIGHAIALRKLRDFQRLGHHVIFLIGSFTALIGDTSDKDSPRQPLTSEQIEENFKTYKQQASKILDFSKIELRYNHEWLNKVDLRKLIDLASKFTVQQMIQREMYKKRIHEAKPIGLHEFLYPLLQGYDSVAMDVDLEIGGRDQLFNMLAGRTLQKIINNKEKHVLTVQLLEGNDGRKMAKTYDNVINITDTPDEQYRKIMLVHDDLIIRYFTLCTDLSMAEIGEIEKQMKAGAHPRDVKMKLAQKIVTMYNGPKKANDAEQYFVTVHQKQEVPSDIPEKKVQNKNWYVFELLVEVGLAKSNSDGRRLIEGGGVYIDDQRVEDPKEMITLNTSKTIKVGKRRFVKVTESPNR